MAGQYRPKGAPPERFLTLRQQSGKREGVPHLALADFIAPADTGLTDYMGGFCVTVHGAENLARAYEEDLDDYRSILVKALADRLAEAAAEYLHREIRIRYWGYAPEETLDNAARKTGIPLKKGIYAYMTGPSFETPAEIRMLRNLGADAVGMSTVPEVITAAHAGMKVAALSTITNMAAGILDQPLTHEEVMETGGRVKDKLLALIRETLRLI